MSEPHPQSPEFVRDAFAVIARRYDLANHLLSGGLDFHWRRVTAKTVPARRSRRILDLATGSGDLALALKKWNPESLVVGADFCLPMLLEARKKTALPLVVADAMQLPFEAGAFDAVTVAFGLRNMRDRALALREMARVLAPGGHVAILDFSLPPFPLRGLYRFYLHRCLPAFAGWITGQRAAYEYLGASIEDFPRGRAMCELMEANGFASAECRPLTFGIVSLYLGVKPDGAASGPPPRTDCNTGNKTAP